MMFIAVTYGASSLSLWNGIGSLRPVGIGAELDDLFHRPGLHVLEAARRLPQPIRQRLEIVLRLDAERARLRAPVLHQDVAEPEARLFDDVLEQDRLVALRGQRADVVDPHRLGDARDDVGVGLADTRAAMRRGPDWMNDERSTAPPRHVPRTKAVP